MTIREDRPKGWNKEKLNNMNPAASNAELGTRLAQQIDTLNTLITQFKALTAKLNLDVGVSDADYNLLDPTATLASLDDPA